jgi:histidinol-phosphate/aromatic aminotransferase/cobyric acid decarboxylase-like protein
MAGLRGGYAVVQKDLSLVLNGFLSGYFGGETGWRMLEGNVNRLASAAIIGGLSSSGRNFVSRVREINVGVRENLVAGLNALGCGPLESHTNFVLTMVSADGEHLRNWLCERKILVQAGGSFHSRYREWIRISVGNQSEVATFLDALADYDRTSSTTPCANVFYKGL